ncbi:carbon storage regulator, partial [Pseudomonas coronafaciens]
MLCLTRRFGESIVIGDNIKITMAKSDSASMLRPSSLSTAPRSVPPSWPTLAPGAIAMQRYEGGSRGADKFVVRLPDDMRSEVERAAASSD